MANDRTRAGDVGGDGCEIHAIIPTFQRHDVTLACIEYLKSQTRPPDHIIVVDGGSRDGTRETIAAGYPDVVLLTPEDAWWGQAVALGIEHVMDNTSAALGQYLLLVNDDSVFPTDYVEEVLAVSQATGGAVSGIIVDASQPERIIDAGEYISWSPYRFPVSTDVPQGGLRDDVDVLPGRGTMIPLQIVRDVGNIDAKAFPHYFADYEFFYRMKRRGHKLVVTSRAWVGCMTETTGIAAVQRKSPSLRHLLAVNFSRRSQSNVFIHSRFVWRHAPNWRTALRILAESNAYRLASLARTIRPFSHQKRECSQ